MSVYSAIGLSKFIPSTHFFGAGIEVSPGGWAYPFPGGNEGRGRLKSYQAAWALLVESGRIS